MAIPDDVERVALMGWRVYPASRVSRAACIQGATLKATSDLDQIARWSHEFPGCNWRMIFIGSGCWALDCDRPGAAHKHDGVAAFKALTAAHDPLPPRPMIRTGGSGGIVLFFRDTGLPIRGEGGHPAPGIDPRRGAQPVTLPPSFHTDTGYHYRWIVPPWECYPPAAPTWLTDMVRPPPEPPAPKFEPVQTAEFARIALQDAMRKVLEAGEGGRNDRLNRQAYRVGKYVARGLLAESEALDSLLGAGRQVGLPYYEAKATVQSGLRAART